MVEGKMKANKLVVLGEMRGDIVDASRAYLGSHARVYGDITAENLTVCEGAYFSGNVKMSSRQPGVSDDRIVLGRLSAKEISAGDIEPGSLA